MSRRLAMLDETPLSDEEYEDYVASVYRGLVSAEQGSVFRGKEYLGKSGHSHAIDVSLELKIAGVELLIFVECKRYRRRVEVGEILEFAQRLSDVSAHKGILVTTTGFQEGAFKVAHSQRIALVIASPYHDRSWTDACYTRGYSSGSQERRTEHEEPPPKKRRDHLRFGFRPRNFSIPDEPSRFFFESSSRWRGIVAALLSDAPLYPYDHYAAELAAECEMSKIRQAEYDSRLNKEAQEHASDGQNHVFESSTCSQCGCTIQAVRHFGWWRCKSA